MCGFSVMPTWTSVSTLHVKLSMELILQPSIHVVARDLFAIQARCAAASGLCKKINVTGKKPVNFT